ncbi:MAG: TlpA family protein disulfide reductase [Deltaproteobacteria bacterium]|nr:TlpA family protein disulfide reductase [Deltaproteobacteria bacterium]
MIKNYAFTGYANPAKAHTLVPISLGDFYNPTGEGLYAEASPFEADKPRPRVLLIDVAARWCAPCQQEAKEILPAAHAKLAPLGAEFLLDLADGIEPGSVATQKDLDKWTTAFAVDYPAVFDPDYQLGALFDASSFPVNIVIDTREMRIATVVKGILDESFWTEIESLLDK